MNKPINIQSFVCEVSKCPDIQRLKSENERLKAENEELFKECENDKKRVYSMKVLSDKYKQALEEVRDCINVLTTVNNGFRGSMVEWKINKILNEVEDE